MKRIFSTIILVVLFYLTPLVGKPDLMLHPLILSLMAACALVWLSQPEIKKEDVTVRKDTDKYSVLIILILAAPSVIVPVMDWAYYRGTPDTWDMMMSVGLITLLAGLAFRIWAIITLGRNFTSSVQIVDHHQLITSGPYSIVRHPSYLGAYLAFAGSAGLLHSWLGLIVSCVLMGLAYMIRIRAEEEVMVGQFGREYVEYMGRVKRMVPGLW